MHGRRTKRPHKLHLESWDCRRVRIAARISKHETIDEMIAGLVEKAEKKSAQRKDGSYGYASVGEAVADVASLCRALRLFEKIRTLSQQG